VSLGIVVPVTALIIETAVDDVVSGTWVLDTRAKVVALGVAVEETTSSLLSEKLLTLLISRGEDLLRVRESERHEREENSEDEAGETHIGGC
jgi:hypothetical protein